MNLEYKICKTCGELLPLEVFRADKRNKDGCGASCKECCKKYDKKYGNEKRNKEEIKKYYHERYNEHKEEIKIYNKIYGIENKDKILKFKEENKEKIRTCQKNSYKKYYHVRKGKYVEKSRIYYQNNKEKFKAYNRAYFQTERGKMANMLKAQKRISLGKGVISKYSKKEWIECKKYFNNKCAYCGEELPLAQDHFIALSKGGEYTRNNIVPSCRACNSSKHNKDYFSWYSARESYSRKREIKILKYLHYNNQKQQQLMMI